jgi:hypothetical protein
LECKWVMAGSPSTAACDFAWLFGTASCIFCNGGCGLSRATTHTDMYADVHKCRPHFLNACNILSCVTSA